MNETTLCDPVSIGRVMLKNRMVVLPMALPARDFAPTKETLDYLVQLSQGGAGCVVLGSVMVCDMSDTELLAPDDSNALRGWDDDSLEVLSEVAKSIQENGCVACAQLSIHYEWRANRCSGLDVVGPSTGASGPFMGQARELTIDEIHAIVAQYGDAALRCKKAGIALVEIHAGMGYLLSRFISSATNKRSDRYGGELANRIRILREAIADCKAKAGEDYPVAVRLNIEDLMPGGNTIEDTRETIQILESDGIAAFSLQAGFNESRESLVDQFVENGVLLDSTAELKAYTSVPVIAAYKLNAKLAASAIESGQADLVGMARACIADPTLPQKTLENRSCYIRPCVWCGRCLDGAFYGRGIRCTMNAQVLSGAPLPEQAQSRMRARVVVVGAGPAGMEAARVAALRGHDVTLLEAASDIGGALYAASLCNEALESVAVYYKETLGKLGVNIVCNCAADVDTVLSLEPDKIVVAVGGKPRMLDVPGSTGDNVIYSHDVIDLMWGTTRKGAPVWHAAARMVPAVKNRTSFVKIARQAMQSHVLVGKQVVIVGGQFAGCETALALLGNRAITIVDAGAKIAADLGPATRGAELTLLRRAGVRFVKNATVQSVGLKSVFVRDAETGAIESIPADTVVVSLGFTENRELYDQLCTFECNVRLAGDAWGDGLQMSDASAPLWETARRLRESIRDGFQAGLAV